MKQLCTICKRKAVYSIAVTNMKTGETKAVDFCSDCVPIKPVIDAYEIGKNK